MSFTRILHQKTKKNVDNLSEKLCSNEQIKIWWDTKIKSLVPVQHSKLNIVTWKKEDKQCLIIDISVVWDVLLLLSIYFLLTLK